MPNGAATPTNRHPFASHATRRPQVISATQQAACDCARLRRATKWRLAKNRFRPTAALHLIRPVLLRAPRTRDVDSYSAFSRIRNATNIVDSFRAHVLAPIRVARPFFSMIDWRSDVLLTR